jgi:hypothetical protein
MVCLVTNIGIIGFSEANGHPYSFSAIINGYKSEEIRSNGWEVIANYLDAKPKEEIGISDARVSHIWTQNLEVSKKIASSTYISNVCVRPEEMLGQVQAVIIARDDWESHFELAKLFLSENIPVFIDKPLTLDLDELTYFAKYLENGLLMSCSGYRYSVEMETVSFRAEESIYTSAICVNDFTKYGIHLLESLAALDSKFISPEIVSRNNSQITSYFFTYEDFGPMQLTCLGPASKTFQVDFFMKSRNERTQISDNFSAFKETLSTFIEMVNTRLPAINPSETISLMLILISASTLAPGETINFQKFYEDFQLRLINSHD